MRGGLVLVLSSTFMFFGTVISFPLSSDTVSHSQTDEKGPYCICTRLFFISASFPFKLTAPSLQGPDHLDNPLVVVRLLSKQSDLKD